MGRLAKLSAMGVILLMEILIRFVVFAMCLALLALIMQQVGISSSVSHVHPHTPIDIL